MTLRPKSTALDSACYEVMVVLGTSTLDRCELTVDIQQVAVLAHGVGTSNALCAATPTHPSFPFAASSRDPRLISASLLNAKVRSSSCETTQEERGSRLRQRNSWRFDGMVTSLWKAGYTTLRYPGLCWTRVARLRIHGE